jgi:glycosyltransferase involved in cell wall biosynthesis
VRVAADIVVIATLLHEDGPTGVQAHFGAFRRYLESINHAVITVTPYSAPSWLVYPVFAVRRLLDPLSKTASVVWYRHWHRVFLQFALQRTLRQFDRAVIYAQCPLSARAALDARTGKSQRVGLVVHFNRSQADEWIEQGYLKNQSRFAERIRELEARTLPDLDVIVYVSRFMQGIIAERIPRVSKVTTAVIPNFCDPKRLVAAATESNDLINVGTLEPRKNQQFLLRVVAEAAKRKRRLTLTLIGDGPDRPRLERLAEELCIAPQVTFLGLQRNGATFLATARAYVHSATMENLPMALIEALGSGKPVFAPNVGGIPDIIVDGQQGFFWPLDDCGAAAELLIRVLDDSDLMSRLSRQARARFDEQFSVARVGGRLLGFLSGGMSSQSVNARAA